MYYLFVIKDEFFKENSNYLYNILYKLKTMHRENYVYGINLYNSICTVFDTSALNYYIRKKLRLNKKGNRFYLDKYNYFDIRKSCCIINSDRYLREILCIFYIYNKNIFVCNFDKSIYFWLNDKFK